MQLEVFAGIAYIHRPPSVCCTESGLWITSVFVGFRHDDRCEQIGPDADRSGEGEDDDDQTDDSGVYAEIVGETAADAADLFIDQSAP